jgi:hypothetical protein
MPLKKNAARPNWGGSAMIELAAARDAFVACKVAVDKREGGCIVASHETETFRHAADRVRRTPHGGRLG